MNGPSSVNTHLEKYSIDTVTRNASHCVFIQAGNMNQSVALQQQKSVLSVGEKYLSLEI